MNSAFFSDLLTTIAERSRALLGLPGDDDGAGRNNGLVDLCEALLSGRGEASGTALAREVLDRYAALNEGERPAFFMSLAKNFGPDGEALAKATQAWTQSPSQDKATAIHYASEPRRQEVFRRLNRAPGGTAALVRMREHLLKLLPAQPELKVVDRDFAHLLASWFNRGFLVLRRIDWSSPAVVLEKIIRYEAVHQIRDWDDLRRRIDPPDRRCYAFFHPALVDEPLIFVEVALTADMPGAVQPLLAGERVATPPEQARTAVFYSISNCQQGLAGVSFGNFLIKQVVEELVREQPQLRTFVTLSPVPTFARWLDRVLADDPENVVTEADRVALQMLRDPGWPDEPEEADALKAALMPLAAHYFLNAKSGDGRPVDPVGRFHLGNGARLERINWLGDVWPRATYGVCCVLPRRVASRSSPRRGNRPSRAASRLRPSRRPRRRRAARDLSFALQ